MINRLWPNCDVIVTMLRVPARLKILKFSPEKKHFTGTVMNQGMAGVSSFYMVASQKLSGPETRTCSNLSMCVKVFLTSFPGCFSYEWLGYEARLV